MPTNEINTVVRDFLLEEFRETWNHYRHIENSREQYLNFFFTVMLASIGFFLAIGSQTGGLQLTDKSILGALVLIWILNILATYFYSATRKAGAVLEYYDAVRDRIRDYIYGEKIPQLRQYLSYKSHDDPIMKVSFFRAQKTAERIFSSGALFLSFIEVCGIIYFWNTQLLLVWELLILYFLI